MSPQLVFALDTVYQAGRSTLGYFGTKMKVEQKADNTPVTEADLCAERMIRSAIQSAYPKDSILGEEEQEVNHQSEARWVIDPIDGTRSFIAGVPLYATLLSLELNGAVQLGVCYFPALDEMVYAEKGSGTFCNGRRCHVSSRKSIENATICHASVRSFNKLKLLNGFLQIADQADAMRTWCDAYGHALVAKGHADAMLDPVVNHWDISPMSIIVREAGGEFTDLRGDQKLSDSAISSNGHIHLSLLQELAH